MTGDATAGFTATQIGGLCDLLGAHTGTTPRSLTIVRTQGGQSNPSFFLEWRGGAAVLRKQPAGEIAPSAHAIDREYRLLEAFVDSDVPAPRPILYQHDPALIGTPFYLMEKLDGRVFDAGSLPGVPDEDRSRMYHAMAEALARLHAFDWRGAGLEDFGRAGDYYVRQFRRWTRFRNEHPGIVNPDLDAVTRWLSDQPFPSEDVAISHGDFRLANVMFAPDTPEVIGILDWELATLGPTAADLAYSATGYYTRPDENGGLLGLDLAAIGIPSPGVYAAAYFNAAGASRTLSLFEQVFALFRAAAGSESIAARARSGQGTDMGSAAFGQRMALAYARGAHSLIEARG